MKKFLVFFTLLFFSSVPSAVFAEGLAISTGAGYMKMMEELCAGYKADTGKKVQEMYGGNIGQVLSQIKAGSGVSVVVSDKGTLEESKSGVKFKAFHPLGSTVLVLAWRKGMNISSPADLEKAEVKSVCYPDPKGAIYGRAAVKYLETSGLGAKIAGKVFQIATVPQIFSYLVTGEMDAGFVNRVMVRAGKDKIGGSLEIADGYPPLNMVAAVVENSAGNEEVKAFIAFLNTEKAKVIMKKHGVW
ncbi:MAG: molybdate ABC transporter substrate-binding protein [Smithellaceae bacterium]|nr:molybdate ABC transporter substrate-binding protein [Smithellaceae bacterium]